MVSTGKTGRKAQRLNTVDIDIGGTFTDGVLGQSGRLLWTKVDTTPHDLTVCFMRCVEELAALVNLTVEELLRQTMVVRLASTVGTNALLQRNGTSLGVMVTKGHESTLYSDGSPGVLGDIVQPDMVAGVPIGQGNGATALDEEAARKIMEALLDAGARGLVVSFKGAGASPISERAVQDIINTEYPRHYLGSVRSWLGSDMSHSQEDSLRTNTAILNGYLHGSVSRFLYKSDELLRRRGYRRPLLAVHSRAGVARVAKTIALNTYNSGPVAGLVGCARVAAALYGIKDFASVDVGGTSVDIGVVKQGILPFAREPDVEGTKVGIPMVTLHSASGGGGSIVHVTPDGQGLQVGPQSAGAIPGPSCYDLGGNEATVTDADVLLGHINPDYFLGGRRRLVKERAQAIFQRKVAQRLDVSLEQAAWQAVRRAEEDVVAQLKLRIEDVGMRPTDVVLFAFGGGGGLRCCAYASALGISRVMAFPYNGVASAVGIATMDVEHFYDAFIGLPLADSSAVVQRYNDAVESMMAQAVRDMRGEGFDQESIRYTVEVVVHGHGQEAVVPIPTLQIKSVEELIQAVVTRSFGGGKGTPDGLAIDSVTLGASCAVPHFTAPEMPMKGRDPGRASKGRRDVYWGDTFFATPLYTAERLAPGNVVEGPAIIEGRDTTFLVPQGWTYYLDQFRNAILEGRGS